MRVIQKLRDVLAVSRTGDVLRRLGVARPALRLYEFAVVRWGKHSLVYDGCRLTFGVRDRFDVSRVDNFLRIERAFINRIRESLRSGDTVFDVGANIGMVSVLLAASTRDREFGVHAFEPNPATADRARQNAAVNGCENVTVHTLALGNENGTTRLHTHGGDCGRDSMFAVDVPTTAAVNVRVERGDYVAGRLGLHPSVVKIDVEGAEMDVLFGMENLLAQTIRELFIEVHPRLLETAGHHEAELVGWLQSRGYRRTWRELRGGESHQHFRRAGVGRQ